MSALDIYEKIPSAAPVNTVDFPVFLALLIYLYFKGSKSCVKLVVVVYFFSQTVRFTLEEGDQM